MTKLHHNRHSHYHDCCSMTWSLAWEHKVITRIAPTTSRSLFNFSQAKHCNTDSSHLLCLKPCVSRMCFTWQDPSATPHKSRGFRMCQYGIISSWELSSIRKGRCMLGYPRHLCWVADCLLMRSPESRLRACPAVEGKGAPTTLSIVQCARLAFNLAPVHGHPR